MNYDPAAKRKTKTGEPITIGEFLMANIGFAKLEAAKALAIEGKRKGLERPTDLGETTKEGDVKMQVEDTDVSAQEALEQEDMSMSEVSKARREKTKSKEKQYSKFRRQLGIETGSDLYNKILSTAKKSLLRAYEVGTSVRNIQRKLRDEAAVYLFKDIKNFLGTKEYINNLKKYRTFIVDAIFTADLVQLEKMVPENERVFTVFDRELTSKADVESAVEQNLLPKEALNVIDKGNAVRLYRKIIPTEKQFIAFFNQPAINPKTGVRSGLKGTRKDALAKAMAGSLSFDATMEVAKDPKVNELRKDIAEIKGQTLAIDDIQQLSAAIGRDIDVKFGRSTKEYNVLKNTIKLSNVLTDRQAKRKFLTVLDKKIKIEKDEYTKTILQELEYIFDLEVELRDTKLAEINFTDILDIDTIIKDVKNTNMPEIREMAHEGFINYLNNTVSKISGKNKQIDEINKFLKNVFRSTRSAGVFNITTNELLLNNVLNTLLEGNFNGNFKLKEVDKGFKMQFSYDGKTFEDVELYENIENIKNNARKNVDLVEKVNEQAQEARDFVFEILDSNLTKGEKTAMIQLIAYDQRGAIRKIAKLGITLNEDSTLKSSELTLEHEITINDTVDILIDYINKNTTKENVEDMFNKSFVHILPKNIDNQITERGYKSKGGINRYDNILDILIKAETKGIFTLTDNLRNRIKDLSKIDTVSKLSKSSKTPTKGISILDFDDTLATTKSKIRFTRPDGTEGTLTPEQYASTYQDLLGLDYKFDFSEFNKVVDGKPAPLLNKAKKLASKFGTKNMFILTARPQESAVAIQKFLKENGLNIPLKNITGLGNSTADAKALWVLDKASEGYNDFYFADDAVQNVQAVQNMLDQIDVKSKVQQARVKFSKSLNKDFNNILENVSGIESNKRFSDAKAKRRGEGKGRFRVFVPPSHEDFVGLLYNFMGKGKKGNEHRDFFEKSLVKPLNRAYRELNAAKQAIANDYRALIKNTPKISKKLGKKILDGDFTNEDAIRVYLWDKFGLKIPGISKTDQKNLVEAVRSNPEIQEFADKLGRISKDEKGYVQPSENWDAGGIKYDLIDATGRIGRAKFFKEFIENTEIIFSKENLNKIQAIFGEDFRSGLEDMLYRVTKGTNRPTGNNKIVNAWIDWINGSVGATMFFNARSAILQQLSFVNFMNFADNNVFKAAARFADQKQFWSDFAMIFNSDYLKQRRTGAGFDVNANEIAREVSGSKEPVRAAIRYLLNIGFLPTQMGDSFAIAIGGASFLRNRINTYLKQELSQKEAEAKAFIDFQEIAEETQQSARPDMISQQQASVLGRFVLAFQNVTSQYVRIMKKSALDLKNRRISKGYTSQAQSDTANISRIIYYGVVQSIVFYGLQTALFAMMFDDDEQDEEFFEKKRDRVINGTLDSILRGTGVYGAVISTLKNTVIKFVENQKSDSWFKSPTWPELLQISPPIGIKIRKLSAGERTADWNKDIIKEMETFDIDNPLWDAITSSTEAITNIPLNRLHRKVQNLRGAADSENAWWQRIALSLGWNKWDVGIEDSEKIIEVKETVKEKKKIESKKKAEIKKKEKKKEQEKINLQLEKKYEKEQGQEFLKGKKELTCSGVKSNGDRCGIVIDRRGKCTIHEKVALRKDGKKSQCKKIKQISKNKKERCKVQTSSKSGFCYYHD